MTVLISVIQTKTKATKHLRDINGKKLTRDENKNVLHCYFKSNSKQKGYRKWMMEIWTESAKFNTSKKDLLSNIDFKESLVF